MARSSRSRYPADAVNDDNFIFRLHYRVTVWLLLILGFLLGLLHYTTPKITCWDTSKETTEFCWSHGTLTVASKIAEAKTPSADDEDLKRYQLIFFKLIFHAVFFYLPRILWKLWEGDKLKTIAKDLNDAHNDELFTERAISLVAEYLSKHSPVHNTRLIAFAVCELLNFINVVVHVVHLDDYLGNILSVHGLNVIGLTNTADSRRSDPLLKVFPSLVHCQFQNMGNLSGLLKSRENPVMCVLHHNGLYEKVFAVLLVWLLLLSVLSGVALIYRVVMLASPGARLHVLRARCRHVPHKQVCHAAKRTGDWFVLYQVSNNVGFLAFTELVKQLYHIQDQDDDKSGVV